MAQGKNLNDFVFGNAFMYNTSGIVYVFTNKYTNK